MLQAYQISYEIIFSLYLFLGRRIIEFFVSINKQKLIKESEASDNVLKGCGTNSNGKVPII